MIFALLNQKGGVGKTTLAVHVAAALARRGRRIILVDADPQGSALDWSASRQAAPLFPVIGLPRPNLHKEVPTHASQYEDVVIDGPPRVNELTRSALLAADMVLIPVQPSPYDVWAAKEIVDLFREAVVVEALAGYNLPVFAASVCQRVSFAESAAHGSTVLEDSPEGQAASEIEAVVNELLAARALKFAE
jgi:chromosome partitioning protein